MGSKDRPQHGVDKPPDTAAGALRHDSSTQSAALSKLQWLRNTVRTVGDRRIAHVLQVRTTHPERRVDQIGLLSKMLNARIEP